MRAKLDHDFKVAFAFDEAAARSIYQEISDHTKSEVSISADLSNGLKVEFSSVDELLSFPNPRSREITGLQFDSFGEWGSKGYSSTCHISFRRDSILAPIAVQMSGEDEDLIRIRRNLEEIIERISRGRGYWIRENVSWISFCAYMLGLVGVAICVNYFVDTYELSGLSATVVLGFVVLYFFAPIIVGARLSGAIRRLFPSAVFLIGNGIERYQQLVHLRRTVASWLFSGLGLSVLLPLFLKYSGVG